MKFFYITFLCAFALNISRAQVVSDTVSMGAGYANQKWYSLQNDEQGSSPKNNWDLAFSVLSAGGSAAVIHINSAAGVKLWLYPSADISGWNTIDTTGLSTWNPYYNSDTSWSIGAFNQGMTSNQFDLGWGVYNMTTHYVTGDSVYIIKLADNTYKKLWIIQLANGTYTFKHANLNGSDEITANIAKSNYSGKNFVYYSIQNDMIIDREPLANEWDLTFTQYTEFLSVPFTVTGVLSNTGVTIAKVTNVADPSAYNNWPSHSFLTPINGIGYDWKTYNYNGANYEIEDSLVYFVKAKTGDIWKMIFTGFDGSASGNFIFTKEKLSSSGGIFGNEISSITSTVYPNPVNKTEALSVIYSFEKPQQNSVLRIVDISGKVVYSEKIDNSAGLHSHNINTSIFSTGVYMLTITSNESVVRHKFIVQ